MQHRYPCGGLDRRAFLCAASASVPLISVLPRSATAVEPQITGKTTHQGGTGLPASKLGAPGLYPGRVVEVKNPRMIR